LLLDATGGGFFEARRDFGRVRLCWPAALAFTKLAKHQSLLSSLSRAERIREIAVGGLTKRVGVGAAREGAVLKDTILAVLNAEARSLGAEQVTERALEDWISEDLFKGPTEKGLSGGGSERRYSLAALRAGLEVVRLKASSPERRNTVLRIRLWLLDFYVPMERIEEDLKSEFGRLLHRHFFRNPWRYDARSDDDLTEREMERELRRAGPLDQTFIEAGLTPPPDYVLGFISELVWGPAGPSQLLKSIEELASPFLSDKGQAILAGFLRDLEPYVAVAGLFGDPQEIERSGLKALDAINGGDLMKGRRLYQFALAMADCAARGNEFLPPNISPALGEALAKTARTLRGSDEWCVAGLAACAIGARRAITPAPGPK
jgi:hypothetical protein